MKYLFRQLTFVSLFFLFPLINLYADCAIETHKVYVTGCERNATVLLETIDEGIELRYECAQWDSVADSTGFVHCLQYAGPFCIHHYTEGWGCYATGNVGAIIEYPSSDYRGDARELLSNIYAKEQNFKKAIEMLDLYKKENPDILEQMAADKKIIKFVQSLRLQVIGQHNTSQSKFLDSIYLSFPYSIENYIRQSKENNIVVAQGYFELTNYYKTSNPEKALEYIIKLDNPIYVTDKQSSLPKNKKCIDCDYGLIYRPMLEFQKADIYLRLGMVKEFETIKSKLLTLSPTLYSETLINEINSLKERKHYKEADALATTTYHNTSYQPSMRSKALFFLGAISYEQGKLEKAKKYFQRVISEFPSGNDVCVSQILLQRINLYSK